MLRVIPVIESLKENPAARANNPATAADRSNAIWLGPVVASSENNHIFATNEQFKTNKGTAASPNGIVDSCANPSSAVGSDSVNAFLAIDDCQRIAAS